MTAEMDHKYSSVSENREGADESMTFGIVSFVERCVSHIYKILWYIINAIMEKEITLNLSTTTSQRSE